MLYPLSTASRTLVSLDGVWRFTLLSPAAFKGLDPAKPLPISIPMAVPAAYNDLYQGKSFREHVGKLAYQRTVSISSLLLAQRLVLRFGSVTHKAWVYLNGALVCTNQGGFLPFEAEIGDFAVLGENLLTVIVDNIVDYTTLPTGRLYTEEIVGLAPKLTNLPNFDFFNYTGIMRPVCLYTTPETYLKELTIVAQGDGSFSYTAHPNTPTGGRVTMTDATGKVVFNSDRLAGSHILENPLLWSVEHPNLYTMTVTLDSEDQYSEPFGFRTVSIEHNRLCLNGKPVYLKGFGKHEDFPVIGRGFNAALNIKDISLMKWMGANSFRTSHYPYSEEMMRLCDQEGILVIDEVPAVGLHAGFTATGMLGGSPKGTWSQMKTADHHRETLQRLIARDKNHPCVIMWSIANEPASEEAGAKEYFQPLCRLCKDEDPQKRPVTIVTYEGSDPDSCKVAELCDVLMLNRYFGWYNYTGNLEGGAAVLKDQLLRFHQRVPSAPIMLGEYGADALAGFHDINEALFSEEFQVAFLKAYHQVLDNLPFVAGEHVWNFADFATAENTRRVGGNKKGVFTRERNPKMAAYYLNDRWKGKHPKWDKNTDN